MGRDHGRSLVPPPAQSRSLPTADQAAGHGDPSGLHQVAAPPFLSHFQQCPFCFIPKLRKQRGGSVHPFIMAAPLTKLPNILGELLGEASHRVVWLGCFLGFTVPLRAFGKPCCAKHGVASSWPLPNLAALHRAGLDPLKFFCLCTLIRVALRPLLLAVGTSGLFLKAGIWWKGTPENLASPLFPWALSTALSWVFALKKKGALLKGTHKSFVDSEWTAAKQLKTLTRVTRMRQKNSYWSLPLRIPPWDTAPERLEIFQIMSWNASFI